MPVRSNFNQGSGYLVGILDGERKMDAPGSHVARHDTQVPGELVLDVQIPLHLVGWVRRGLYVDGLQRAETEQVQRPVGETRVGRTNQNTGLVERSCTYNFKIDQVRYGDNIIYSE